MVHAELLRYLAEVFDRLQLRYAVTGSTATSVYGEARFTNDIDVVVSLPPSGIDDFMAAFPSPGYYLSRSAVESAVVGGRQFNIIRPDSGLKVDVIVATASDFDRQRLDRSRQLPILVDRSVSFASPEDVVIKKLQYFHDGGSEKHLRDIAGVLRVQGNRIDRDRIADWSQRLGIGEAWKLALRRLAAETDATGEPDPD
jgi:hypothetical protein